MARRSAAQLAQTRDSILGAAKSLFADKGFANTQIAEIADAAGVGISSFYRQFPEKDAVLRTLIDQLLADLRTQLASARSGIENRTPLDQVLTIQRTYDIVFGVMAANPDVALTMLRSGYGTALDVERRLWTAIDALVQDIAADLARVEAEGMLDIARKQDFGDAVVGMVIQLTHRMLVDGEPSPTEAARFCTRFTVGAMLMFMPKTTLERLAPLIGALPW